MRARQPKYPRLLQQRAKAPAGGFGWQIGGNEIRHVKSLIALMAAVINGSSIFSGTTAFKVKA
jgi:hypothetical protein